MSADCITYGRGDILRLNSESNSIKGLHIEDSLLFKQLSRVTYNGLYKRRPTKRGVRGGKRTKGMACKRRSPSARPLVTAQSTVTTQQNGRRPRDNVFLPSVLYTNCRSLNTWKLAELQSYAEIHKPGLICLTETWLDNNKQELNQIDGYNNHFANRSKRIGGGVAILSSSHLDVTVLSTHKSRTVSAVWVLVSYKNFKPLIICCIYHPPNADQTTTIEYITNTILKLTPKHPNAQYVLTGDFNRLPTDGICEQFALKHLVEFPTRDSAKLDVILTDIPEYQPAKKLSPLARNDHCCILVEGQQFHKSMYVKREKRLITPERRNSLLSDLASANWEQVLSSATVNEKVAALHNTINQLLDKHCPTRIVKERSDKPLWMTPSILKLIDAKDKAYQKGCPSWKFLQTLCQKAIRSSKRKFTDELLNKEQNTKAWWDTVKLITNNLKKSTLSKEYAVINGVRQNNLELATNLNNYYRSVGGEVIPSAAESRQLQSDGVPLQPISIGEVKHLLNTLDTTKATSAADFPAWVSKLGKEDICIPLHNIFNCILSTGDFPDFWKMAQIVPLPKVSHPTVYKDFRPISLLFHLGKLAEQVVINKLKGVLCDVIANNQYAYRSKVGTTDAILQLIDDCTLDLDHPNSKYVQLASLDFSKAFDRLQPTILIDKMLSYGVKPNILRIIEVFE